VKYVSTRGGAAALGFEDVLLTGLARDGGLYVPAAWPSLSHATIADMVGRPYQEVARTVIQPFVGDEIPDRDLGAIIDEAYGTFSHPMVAPLVQTGPSDWILELFHGPTLAFKDVAMQVLARLMDRALQQRGKTATIVGATSGDTGGAAIEAFRGRKAVDIFILFPKGRVSDVQRRQMTTPADANVHAIALEGTFDDCQNLLKALFNDLPLRDRLGLAGVNSINWARLVAQIVYYFTAATAIGAPERRVSFSVPSGNFGDIFAGYVARKMGLPIERLVIATNVNDILVRTLETGRYTPAGVVATTSPSMDIQISSNFERLLFELAGRDPARVRAHMQGVASGEGFVLSPSELESFRSLFQAVRIDETATLAEIRRLDATNGYLADPHSAIGVAAAAKAGHDPRIPMVSLATAHPAKFPDAVMRAVGRAPPVPAQVEHQGRQEERFEVLPNDFATVARYIEGRRGAGRSA
jgi:threonine synthase